MKKRLTDLQVIWGGNIVPNQSGKKIELLIKLKKMTQLNEKQLKSLLAKLRLPIHVSYISKYILKLNEEETIEVLDNLEKDGIIKQYDNAKGYYVVSDNQSKK
jgi:hypothetical protein